MRALWSDRPNCSHNVSQKVKRIRRVSEQSLSRTLRVMGVRAKSRGRPHQKVCFPAAPVMGEKFLDPRASGRKGQECPQANRTKNF